MNRKISYKNKELHRKACNHQRKRYYDGRDFSEEKRRLWTEHEIEMILLHDLTDTELAKKIRRSVRAIQVKRAKIKKTKNLQEEKHDKR